MSLFARLRLIRVILAGAVALRAFGWGLVVVFSIVIGTTAVDSVAALSVDARRSLLLVAALAAFATIVTLVWRDRRVGSLHRIALWVEERDPRLQFALVTAVETGDERFVTHDGAGWTKAAARGSLRATLAPMAIAVLAALLLSVLPRGAVARIRAPRAGDALDRGPRRSPNASRLTPLVARVQPPAYTGEASTSIDEPAEIRAVAGSEISIEGRGDAAGIVANVAFDTILATRDAERWRIRFVVPTHPIAVRLHDRSFERVIGVEPVIDSPPTVTLVLPSRDSVVHDPHGRVQLRADVSDDFGAVSAAFELIVSSGEGETFTFRSGTIGGTRLHDRRASVAATLSLDSLALKPGDMVHVRAVARDGNVISGPGHGASETRVIRVARPGESDSVAVDAAPPSEADRSLISERMLIQLAEALERRRPSLARDTVVSASRAIAADQKRLRRTVGEIIFTRLGGGASGEEHSDDDSPVRGKTMEALIARADSATNRGSDPLDFEGGESPVVATNRPLLEAYNAMWDATTELEVGQPARALPHMRRALAAIQRARQAERLYLRGQGPEVVIDLDKVRLKGKERGVSSVRRGLVSVDSARQALERRLLRDVELASRDPRGAIDSLLVLRIDALGNESAFAAAVGDAVTAMRARDGGAATTALARARRALGGDAVARDSLGRWGLVP